MCHMFLVPVFETGSLRTFQLSPHTKVVGEEERKIQKDTQREGEKEDEEDARNER